MKTSSTPSGIVFLCLLVEGNLEIEFPQPLGQWLTLLLLLGMFWGLGVMFQHIVSTRTLCPQYSAVDPAKQFCLEWKHLGFEYPRSRAAWDWHTNTDHLCQCLKWQGGTQGAYLSPLKCEERGCFHVFTCLSLLLRRYGQASVSVNVSSYLFAMVSVSWQIVEWIGLVFWGIAQCNEF